MTIYDGSMAILVIAGMIWGAIRGITWQIASIASLVVGYSVAHPVSAQLAPHFPGDPVVARGLAMLATYAAVSGGIFLAAWLVRATLQKMKFEAYDRHLGMLLGGLEGALIGLVGTLFVVSLAPSSRAAIFESPTGQVVGQVMSALGPVLPTEVRTKLAPFWDGKEAPAVAREEEDVQHDVRTRVAITPQNDDAETSPAAASESAPDSGSVLPKIRNVLEKEEEKLGKAIVDSAKQEMQRIGEANDRDLERR